jgi:hypothetical protein
MFSGIENERLLSINPIIKTSEFNIFLIWHLASILEDRENAYLIITINGPEIH